MQDRERKFNYHIHIAVDQLSGKGMYAKLSDRDRNTLALAELRLALEPVKP